jgi:hypothetical protein
MKSNYFIIILFVMLVSCKQNKDDKQIMWNKIMVDSFIKNDSTFSKLNTKNEVLFPFKKKDLVSKQSCDIFYFDGKQKDYKIYLNNGFYRNYKCIPIIDNLGVLKIIIDYSDGFSSHGFTITCKNKEFTTTTYYHADFNSKEKKTHKIIYQKLILNKAIYQLNDSIFGKIEFKSIDKYSNNFVKEHNGKGFFRGKIIKPMN